MSRNRSSDIAAGRVSEVPFARIFGAIALRRLTGILRLEQDNRRYALYFQDGAVADADSSAPEDTLGRVALEAQLVEGGVVGDSLRRMAQDATKSQKDALVELGALRGDALERALRLTLTRRTLRAFMLPYATFTFEEQGHRRLEGGPVEPRWSLYRGLRMHYDERRLDLEMSNAFVAQAFRLSVDPADIYDAFGFSNDERVVLGYLDRARTNGFYWELGDLVDACMTLPRATVLAVVHALHAFENIELKPAATVTRFRKARREPTQELQRQTLEIKGPPTTPPGQVPNVKFTPPTGAPINPARGAPTERNPPVDSPWPRANGTNPPTQPFAAQPPAATGMSSRPSVPVPATPTRQTNPGVSPTRQTQPGVGQGQGQGQGATRQTNPDVPRPSGVPPVAGTRTGTLPPSVRPASGATIVGNSGGSQPLRGSAPSPPAPGKASSGPMPPYGGNQRVTTDAGKPAPTTRDMIMAKFADVEKGVDHFTLLEIDRSSSSEQAKAAYFRLVKIYHSDKLALSRLESLRPQVDRIMSRLTEAFGALSDENKRAAYLRLLASGGEEAAKKQDAAANAQVTKILIAEDHFKRGEMALRRENYAAALEEFQSAVEQNETEAAYHAFLGWAKFLNSSDKHAVKEEVRADFSKALKLNNRCIDAYFFRGRMFNELGEPERARKAFESVLSLNEDHVEASREIRIMDMRKSKAGGFFDIFRKKTDKPKPPKKD